MADYKVTVARSHKAAQRVRAGVSVSKADGYEGPLEDEQVKAIKADPVLTLTEVKADKKSK